MSKPTSVNFRLPDTNMEYCEHCEKEAMVIAVIEDTVPNRLCYEHFESLVGELNDKGITNNSKKIIDYFEKQKKQKSRNGQNGCLPLSKY